MHFARTHTTRRPRTFGPALTVFTFAAWTASACGGGDAPAPQPSATDLTVSAAEARACELVLEESTDGAVSATFTGVTGATVREAPLVAISFAADADAPIAPGAVKILVSGAGAAPKITRARCFDRLGQPLTADVKLGG